MLEKENCGVDSSLLRGLILTVKYDGAKAVLTTGTSYQTFVMDKSPDQIWDTALMKYLSRKEIPFEQL